MRKIEGLFWPDDVADKWQHSLRHMASLDWTLKHCGGRRTAVQAGGNIGIWPRRMAEAGFRRVLTFEPDVFSRKCLERNVSARVEVYPYALGAAAGECDIHHRSLGSHRVVEGSGVNMVPLDSFRLEDVDLLQLDIEGYEWHALAGAVDTLTRCRPMVHIELRGFTEKYGHSDEEVRELLRRHGYKELKALPGNDFVFKVLS
jgi:FkbM family methyltransferase